MGQFKKKCNARAWGRSAWCDGCRSNSTKCPQRFKFRELRNTRKGAKYHPKEADEPK